MSGIPKISMISCPTVIISPKIPVVEKPLTPRVPTRVPTPKIPTPNTTPKNSPSKIVTQITTIEKIPTPTPTNNQNLSIPFVSNLKLPSSVLKIPNTLDLEETNVEKKLASRGYIPQERILINTSRGIEGRYIKVVNERGQVALVELDSEGVVAVKSSDIILFEGPTSSIPISTKVGTLETAGMEVTGIAFQCENGYCTVIRNPTTLEPKEVVLIPTTVEGDNLVLLSGAPIPYPIVRYSEIIASPNSVNNTIDAATRRMRNNVYKECMAEIKKTDESSLALSKASSKYIENQTILFEKIKDQIRWLEGLQKDYLETPPKNSSEQEKMATIPLGLKCRFEKQMEQMVLCQKVALQRQEIDQLTKKFDEYTQEVIETVKALEFICK